mmetsp:Transcript_104456/g.304911  ORF Transcript_104456/g.304911 Transcript_104456/m.304911 type:complete len:210 (+) Transcript_104456:320-949(+)
MRHPQLRHWDRRGVDTRLPLDGAYPCVGVEQVQGRIPFRVEHLLVAEGVRRGSVLLHVKVPDSSDADLLCCILLLLGSPEEDLSAFCLLTGNPRGNLLGSTLYRLIKQVAKLHRISRPRLELLAVVALDDAEAHVINAGHRWPMPPSLLGSIEDHVEVEFLAQVRDVHYPVCTHQEQAVVDGSQVSRVIPEASIRFDSHQRNLRHCWRE